jgi:hypothetical protein
MNQKQKLVAIATAIVLAGMLLFPPCRAGSDGLSMDRGFAPIFSPPDGVVIVNVAQLMAQVVVVGIIGLLLGCVCKETGKSARS